MSVPDDDDDDGKSIGPARRYDFDDFLEALEEMDGMATTPEISDIVGCSNDTTRRRMEELEQDEDTAVSYRKAGKTVLWMLDRD